MIKNLKDLNPKALWKYFDELNKIPRGSKKERKAAEYVFQFGKNLGLDTKMDEIGNVVISKKGSKGRENEPIIILQGHVDMVHQKNNDTQFNFDTDPIESYVDGDFVKAKGTTLGADNGIGVAAAMAVLSSDDISHPPLEALFTVDEETGMSGANALKADMLKGRILLNLDTEEDDELTIGCAGGIDVSADLKYNPENIPSGYKGYKITIKALKGGHSGVDIHLGRANANKILFRFIYQFNKQVDARISQIEGGGLRNAIPREAEAILFVENSKVDVLKSIFTKLSEEIKYEYRTVEPDMLLLLEDVENNNYTILPSNVQKRVQAAIYGCVNGVFRMSAEVEGLVETSSNLAKVSIKNGDAIVLFLTRSSSESSKYDMVNAIESVFEIAGFNVITQGSYPGWSPNPKSAILARMIKKYKELFGKEPKVAACHAGLECGIIGSKFSEYMDMVSFGPNIAHPHSPDEKVQISSVEKFWKFLIEILK